jgi:phosphoadenosine phosphosulfate reductase
MNAVAADARGPAAAAAEDPAALESLAAMLETRTPVVLVDMLYLFTETLQFATELASRLDLDLRIFRAPLTAAEFEARHRRLWEQGAEGLVRYKEMVKLEPLRRAQSTTRRGLPWHPLWDKGYVSTGDWHSTRTLAEADDQHSTRFGGLMRECGLHGLEG